MQRWIGWGALLALVGCRGEHTVLLAPAWPEDQVAVVVFADADSAPLSGSSPRILEAGRAIEISSASLPKGAMVLARTFKTKQAGGPDFVTCGVALGGSGERIGAASGAYRAKLDEAEIRDRPRIDFVAESPPVAIDLRFSSACPSRPLCSRISARSVRLPFEGQDLFAVAPGPGDDVLIGGSPTSPSRSVGSNLFRMTPDGPTSTVALAGITGRLFDLARDGADGWIGLTDLGELFHLDHQLKVSSSTRVADMSRLRAGRDGSALIIHENRDLIEVVKGSTRTRPRTDAPPGITRISVDTSTRVIAAAEDRVFTFDGSQWEEQHLDTSFTPQAVTAGEHALLAAMRDHISISESPGAEWHSIPFPTGLVEYDGNAGANIVYPGYYAVWGGGGRLDLWIDDAWCEVNLSMNEFISDVWASPDGRRVLGVTNAGNDFTSGYVFWVELPEK